MPRRPSAGSRSSSSRADRGARASATRSRSGAGRQRSDGKVDIYCPQCAAHYRIAADALDSKVTCTECTRTFFAKTTVGKRARKTDNTRVYLGFGLGALVIVVTMIAINAGGGSEASPRRFEPVKSGPSEAEIAQERRRDQLMRWAGVVAREDIFGIRNQSDMPALAQALGMTTDPSAPGFDSEFLAALKQHDAGRLLFEMEISAADVSPEAVAAGGGLATLFLRTKPGDEVYDAKAGGRLDVQWRATGDELRVTGLSVTKGFAPIQRGIRPGDEGKYFKPSEDIARPKEAEMNIAGKSFKVNESEPVPLGHEPGTTPQQQAEIDEWVAKLIESADPMSPGPLFMRATMALEKIGKPAVPRLLNALHDLYPDVTANNDKIKQVTRCLLTVTGMQFAYDFRGEGDAATVKKNRESSIRQWFAWWWRYANDTHTAGIEEEEDLDAPAKPAGKDGKDGKTGR